ncbi:D-alanyl-D-alanine carboxypeptidase [Streptomyces sp. BPTC-684]|uniref:D-alanyl-D-alanine carboxypeptidase n=1 Tax=Streptomyces sp. BPTC-684 TaxID=3043734 RepID=UPI0024B14F59|nr:D-alanyl-D-alanine carboxypeptidase [Streptomyces sp. BPTC-684]WHM38230.1 D-alanyl-D-alanine carboxypeptidase [Streptomyces sp. BPTC-684]
MAGESPDRSEQQQSSGETTPSERDPRVAVFGSDDGPRAASGSGSVSGPERNGSAKASANGSANGSAAGSANGSAKGAANGSVNGSGDGSGADRAADGDSAPVDQATAVFRTPRQEDHESRDTRLRAAVAAWVATDDDADAAEVAGSGSGAAKADAPAAAAEKPDGTGADAEGAAEEPAAEATPVRETVPAPTAAPEADDASDASGDEPAAQESGEKAAAAADDASEPEADAEAADEPAQAAPEAAAEPDAAPEAEKDAEKDSKPDAKPEPEPKSDAKSDAKDSGAEPEADAEPERPSTPADKPAPEGRAASWGAKPSAESAGKPEAVDQPTAVFKAVKPPVVDQPTTAIRRPGAGERASTFVPLRSDDVRPDTEKPKTEAPKAGDAKAEAPKAAAPAAPKLPTSPRISVPDADAAERTRQQPLPPKPPLDLLAELTNTPPPPQTPVRTAVRRFKIWTPLVLLLLIVFAVVQFVRPLPDAELKMTSAPEFTFEGGAPQLPWPSEGQGIITVSGLGTVGRFGEEKPVPIASVTKSMTAYIIMRDHPMKVGSKGASIPVDELAEKEGGYNKAGKDESTVDTIKAGQNLTQKDALSAVMIPSANNVARLLARWDAGSEAAFVKKMNDTAKQLGMTNTTYTDPSGLNATTVSTAVDQVKLATELVKDPALVDITRQPYWYDSTGRKWPNYNKLVPFNGAIGIKTGSTTKAGGNLLFAAVKEVGGTKQTIVGAVFGQHKAVSILDLVNKVSKDVLIATRKSLTSATVIKKGAVVGYVDDGLGGRTPVVATKDLTVAGWSGLRTAISLTPSDGKVPHSAKAGTVVGKLTVGSGSGQVSAPVALQKALAEPGFGSKLTRLG